MTESESDFPNLYPSLSKLSITAHVLLAVADDSDNGSDIEALRIPCATNQNIIELYNFMNRNTQCTFYTMWRWIASLLGDRWPQTNFPTIKSIRQCVLRLNSKLTNIKKFPSSDKKDAMLSKFFNEEYTLPRVFVSHGELTVHTPSDDSSSCSSCAENKVLKSVNASLSRRICESRHKMYSAHRNSLKKLKRREQVIEQQRKEVSKIDSLQKKVEKAEDQIGTL